MEEDERRKDPRFKIRSGQALEVTLAQNGARPDQSVLARLIDISRGGAKLSLSSPVLFNSDALLRLKSASLGLDLTMTAGMCWSRPEEDRGWLLGCSFSPRLPLEVLSRLIESDVLERRTAARRPRRIPITAQWELDPAPIPGYLWDVSEGGFCFLSPSKAGEQVTISPVETRRSTAIQARRQWALEVGGGYVVGCSYLNAGDHRFFEDLQGYVEPQSDRGALGRMMASAQSTLRSTLSRCFGKN
jgi:hypothetical protein